MVQPTEDDGEQEDGTEIQDLEWAGPLLSIHRELACIGGSPSLCTVSGLFGYSALGDLSRLNLARVERDLPEHTVVEAANRRQQLIEAHEYGITGWTTFEELVFEFQTTHPTGAWSVLSPKSGIRSYALTLCPISVKTGRP
jgi:hypothetical protein